MKRETICLIIACLISFILTAPFSFFYFSYFFEDKFFRLLYRAYMRLYALSYSLSIGFSFVFIITISKNLLTSQTSIFIKAIATFPHHVQLRWNTFRIRYTCYIKLIKGYRLIVKVPFFSAILWQSCDKRV